MGDHKEKTVLITGGNGFIGNHLKKYLQDRYHVAAMDSKTLDVRRKQDFEQLNEMNIAHVIHLAGKTCVPESWENPEAFFETNITGTLNTVEFCRKNKAGMTYISTYIYGQPRSNPVSETAEVNPNNPYAKSKYMGEELCRFFCEHFEMDITVLRLFNVFGPGQKESFLIPFVVKQILDEGDTVCVQDLMPKRDYVYIDDVCRVIELSVNRTGGYRLYNIGSGISYSVGEIIEKAQRIAGTKKQIISRNNVRRNEMNDVVADISLIEHDWNWKPEVVLEAGLAKCLEGTYE